MTTQTESYTRLHGKWLLLARLAWVATALLATIVYAASTHVAFNLFRTPCYAEPCDTAFENPTTGVTLQEQEQQALSTAWYNAIWDAVLRLLYLGVALLIFWRRSDDWVAHLASIMLVTLLAVPSPSPLILAETQPFWRLPLALLQAIALASTVSLFYLFPDGHFVPRWTRGLAIALWIVIGVLAASGASFLTEFPIFGIALATGAVAQIYRYRRVSSPLQRQQTKWVVLGLAGMALPLLFFLLFAFFNPSLNSILTTEPISPQGARIFTAMLLLCVLIPFCFFPVTFAFSLLRHRLWDVDIVINRTLVYGALTSIVVGAFVVLVGLLSTLFQSTGNSIVAILATGLVALFFNPLRQRLQLGVNRLMYGERDDPYAVLSRLGQRLEAAYAPESVLPTIVETVAQTLKLPYVAIALNQGGEFKIAAEFGHSKNESISLPLIHQGEPIGELILALRAPGEHFTTSERQLLDDLARQAGVAAHAVRLTADLQGSRERLVAAREEERRRLRRDLHDGLGPQLASLALKLEAARNRMADDPQAAILLTDLSVRTQEAVADIRRLVYALRPPALDELGLIMALREGATQYNQQGANGLNITFDAPENLPPLPAAVEVAVYRIAQEALTNVVRHAQAHTCCVRVRVDDSAGLLCLEVQDDGKGLPIKRRAGVGLNSMRERAEELGGSFMVTSGSTGGTLLTAHLPCRVNEQSHRSDRTISGVSQKEV